MENNSSQKSVAHIEQLEKYAWDLTEIYNAEKKKRMELEIANQKLEEAKDMLVQSEKLVAIGRLTAGVAHEILNPINIISMRLQFMEITEKLSEQGKDALAICGDQLDRIIRISKDLGQFSRIHEKHVTMSDLNAVIKRVLNLTAPQFKQDDITTDVQYEPTLPLIPLYKDRVEQVLLNIFSNASQAMANEDVRTLRVMVKPVTPEGYALVVIADSGGGISENDMKKIFDPFFTTKETGKGTGLGLFISYNIIKEHDGRIWAENNEWGGTSFFIEFPVHDSVLTGRFINAKSLDS